MFRFLLKVFFILILSMASARAQQAGTMDYDTVNNRYVFYDGSSWRRFNTGIGLLACSDPAKMEYNALLGYYRYCNGTTWIPIVGLLTLSACAGEGKMDFFNSSYYYCNGLLWVNMSGNIV